MQYLSVAQIRGYVLPVARVQVPLKYRFDWGELVAVEQHGNIGLSTDGRALQEMYRLVFEDQEADAIQAAYSAHLDKVCAWRSDTGWWLAYSLLDPRDMGLVTNTPYMVL
jgi:hypothetical protein